MTRLLIAGGLAIVAMLIANQLFDRLEHSAQQVGASQERSRVESAERKIDAKVKAAQRAAAGKPVASVLERWRE